MYIEPLSTYRHVPPGTGPHANVLDALFDPMFFVPENAPVQFTALAAQHHAEPMDAMSPFFSKAFLYPLLGKEDARAMLAHVMRVLQSLDIRDDEAGRPVGAEAVRR